MDFQSGFGPNKNPILAFTGSLSGVGGRGGGRAEEDEREERKTAGELVGQRWRHSDQSSRVEQLMKSSFQGGSDQIDS